MKQHMFGRNPQITVNPALCILTYTILQSGKHAILTTYVITSYITDALLPPLFITSAAVM
jgi:Ni/Fe-hydrogenase subunit HybB-like protein